MLEKKWERVRERESERLDKKSDKVWRKGQQNRERYKKKNNKHCKTVFVYYMEKKQQQPYL